MILKSNDTPQHSETSHHARLTTFFAVLAGLGLALMLAHSPMLLSGFARFQSDLGDTRLNNYFLEHSYRWITLQRLHAVIWSPPFFYPQVNVLAYSDLMLSFAPFYWCWRFIGAAPDTAFQLWMLVGTSLNFLLSFYWLRNCWRAKLGGAVAGAVLFAAAGSRVTQLGHQQLLYQLFPLMALIAIHMIFETSPENRAKRRFGIGVVAFSIVAQFWGGFYNGLFLVLILCLAGALALTRRESQSKLIPLLRTERRAIQLTLVAMALLLAPVAIQYLSTMHDVGGHPYSQVRRRLVPPLAWVLPGPFSLERASLARWVDLPYVEMESAVSLGIVTSFLVIGGIWMARKRPGVGLLAMTAIAVVALITVVGETDSLWWAVYKLFPGATAVRAPGRLGLMLLAPAAVGVAYSVDHLAKKNCRIVAMALCAIALEQASVLPSYDREQSRARVNSIATAIPSDAKLFLVSGINPDEVEQTHIDAMWAGLIRGVPTLNGYSGNAPTHWALHDIAIQTNDQDRDLTAGLEDWLARSAIDPRSVVRIETTGSRAFITAKQPQAIEAASISP